MDEPTSALSWTEVEKLFRIIRDLKAQGLSIIFVTHRLEEVMQLCDRYTVLRDGHLVGSGCIADTSIDDIIRLMVGRQVAALFAHRERAAFGEVALRIEGLSGGVTHRTRTRPSLPMSVSKCARARSLALPGSSAPDAPRWRGRFSAPTRSIPVA